MKLLNVVDLDKTLINIDSFRYLVFKKMNFHLFFLTVLRVFKLISRYRFARGATEILKDVLSDESQIGQIVEHLKSKINRDVLQKIQQHSANDSVTVVLSSSPREYVVRFAQEYGFLGAGSCWEGDKYFHCYGENKIKRLSVDYPPTEYKYNFAVSDDESDINLLKMFGNYQLYKRNK